VSSKQSVISTGQLDTATQNTPPPSGSRFFYGWVVVAVGGVLTFLGTGFFSYSRGVFLPSLVDDIGGGSRFAISLGFSLSSVLSALLAIWLGRQLDHRSPKRIILIGIGLVTLSYLLLSVMQELWQFYAIISIGMGAGMLCMGNLAWHRTVMNWFDHWRGRAISLGVLGASLAGVVMPPLVTTLVDDIGWRTTYVVFAGIVVCVLVPIVILLLKDRPEDIGEVRDGHAYVAAHPEQMVDIPEDREVLKRAQMFRMPAFWSIGLIFGSMGCVYSMVMLHLFGHATDLGFSGGQAASILSLLAGFAAAGKPVIGWMSDAFGAKVTVWLALSVQSVSLLVFGYAESYSISLVAAALYGFGLSGMSPLRTFAISVSMGSASFGAANGVLRLVELPLLLSASPLAGYIYDTTGSYTLAFLILSALMAVACVGPFFIATGGAVERQRRRQATQQNERATP